MGTSAALNEQSIVCRTCLKVLDTTGFTYIDDESGYVKNVGNIREMIQFCIPELDLYVSTQPVICYQCLPILVQVYNFKIKCLNGENIIKAYITRNNLQEYNHVNLNCVLMDDLKLKSQKIHIESRIKHMMLKELPENNETPTEFNESLQIMKYVNQASQETMDKSFNIIFTDPGIGVNLQDNQQALDEKGMKFEVEVDEADIDYDDQSEDVDGDVPDVIGDMTNDISTNDISKDNEVSNPMQINIVAVRKDLFENNNQSNKTSTEQQQQQQQPVKDKTTLILNNGCLPQNGRIVIKIDRKKLENLTSPITAEKESTVTKDSSDKNTPEVTPPPLTPLQISVPSSSSSEHSYTPQIVTVETVEDTSEKEETYNCNKCCYVTNDVIKIYDHNRTYHNFDYTCQHCPFSTSKVELLGKHMTMVHPQNMVSKRNLHFKVTENYACSMCPFSVKSIDLLRSHHLSAHGTTDGDKGPIVLNTAFSEDISRHEPRILKRFEYTCDVCPYTTKDKSNLRKHLFTHGTKPLKCDHCTYKCVSPYQLRRHQKQKHAKHLDPRPRNQPYKLPDFKKEKSEAMDTFKITLETIKRELEKEIST